MQRLENRSMRWVGPVVANALTHTVVHIFPSGGPVTAPYPCSTRLTLFGNDIDRKSLVIDGARLSQPDGIDLREAFPILQQGSGSLYGLEVEVNTTQPRIDLQCSRCVFEFVNKDSSVRFFPAAEIDRAGSPLRSAFIEDTKSATSFVVINRGATAVEAAGLVLSPANFLQMPEQLTPASIREIPVANRSALQPIESSKDELAAGAVEVRAASPELFCYLMVRDSTTRRPVSMVAL